MLCPYCGNDMLAGKIRGDGRRKVRFLEGNHRKDFSDEGLIERNILRIRKSGFPNFNFEIDAFVCHNCEKIIIDYASDE
jgi:hypothetical protein